MRTTAKRSTISVSPSVAREVDTLAKEERLTKTDLLNEMVKVYRQHRHRDEYYDEAWVAKLVEEARQHPMSREEQLAEEERLTAEVKRLGKSIAIKPKDVVRIIHEYREEKRAKGRSR